MKSFWFYSPGLKIMKCSLLTFSNATYAFSKRMLIRSARKHGVQSIYSYSDLEFSKTRFYQDYQHICTQPRGAGYWIWKPYYILEHLHKAKEGEILVYCDSGIKIVASFDPLVQLFNEKCGDKGVMLFHNYQGAAYMPLEMEKTTFNQTVECRKNKYWAKRDVFVLMGFDEPRYWDSPQLEGCFGIFKKTDFSLQFVEEWLRWCCDERVLTDLPNTQGKENFAPFIMHIHDQVILSLLAEKHGLEIFRCPSQFGNHMKMQQYRREGEFLLLPYAKEPSTNSPYDTLLDHHRTKKMPFLKQLIFDTKVFLKSKMNKLTDS